MRLIGHRGNLKGANPLMENNPSYINVCLNAGYDAEVDVSVGVNNNLYTGHDFPKYKIEKEFLQNQRIWVHCKTINTFLELSKYSDINCFLHKEEEIVSTSQGYLWAHSKCTTWNSKTIIVNHDSDFIAPPNILGICSDYISKYPSTHKLPFDLLIIDIDGILTDGTKIYDIQGKVSGKRYCDLDFTAIKRFQAAGIKIVFLSGDQTINRAMAETRKITFFYNPPGINKTQILPIIKTHFNRTNYKIAYVGDDYYDIDIMGAADLAFCPKSSPAVVKRSAVVIDSYSGYGVIAKLYDMFENQIPYAYPIDSPDVNPK